MNVKKRGKRIFGACVLLVMAVLAVCTVAFATESDTRDSYSLVIEKKFAADTPEEVLAEAKKQTYTFRIEGTVREEGEYKPYFKEIKLGAVEGKDKSPVWRFGPINFGEPYNLTVTEITDNIEIEVEKDGEKKYYNMSGSSTDAVISVNSRKHKVELKNNSTLTIKRPDNDDARDELWYHVTNEPYDEHGQGTFKPFDKVFSIRKGGEEKLENLCAAIYTIEQIAPPDGYTLKMGERTETVTPGEKGYFHINGTPGSLTLTAGGSKDDGASHSYTIDRTETEQGDTSEFVARTVTVASGDTCRLDNLPKGGYTVTENPASEAFTVTVPEIEMETAQTKNGKSSAISYDSSYVRKSFPVTGQYVQLISFGPLYDENIEKITDSNIKYEFYYGVKNSNKDLKKIGGGPFNATGTPTMKNPPILKAENSKIYFSATNVTDRSVAKVGVSWKEYTEKEVPNNFDEADIEYKVNVDVNDGGWIKITAPAKDDTNSSGVAYYYTLKNSKGNLIILSSGRTDKEGTTLKRTPGQSMKITGLSKGWYTITETVVQTPVGFTMKVNGSPFGTTEAGKSQTVKVGGQRTVTVSKPSFSLYPETCNHQYPDNIEYTFQVTGPEEFSESVSVKPGETSREITLPRAGDYTITPEKDLLETYNLSYTDSGAVYGTVSGSISTVTFINAFNQGDYGYRFIHEYYVRDIDDDGSYTYTCEGKSQITTRLGRKEGELYQALDIQQVSQFEGNSYKHFEEAYGWVDGISSETETQMDMDKDFHKAYNNIKYPVASSSTAQRNPNDDSDEEYDMKYPVASASSARRNRGDNFDEEYDIEYFAASVSSARRNPDSGSHKRYDIEYIIASSSTAQRNPDHGFDGEYDMEYPVASPSSAQAKLNREAPTVFSDGKDSYDDRGIINKGVGKDSKEKELNYEPISGKNHIDVTKDASQIIILRYYRDKQPKGDYNVIHVYYFRDENGDQWEGISGVRLQDDGELGIKYTGDDVGKEYSFQPERAEKPYTYTWDGRPQYGVIDKTSDTGSYDPSKEEFAGDGMVYRPNNAWTSVEATEEGNQIIILRYYREPVKVGTYNIVHEYYFREASDSQDSEEEESQESRSAGSLNGDTETGSEEEEDGSGSFTGTINRNDGYVYTFEGRTEIERSGSVPLGEQFTAKEEDRKYQYNNTQYTYLDAGYGTTPDHKNYTSNPNQQWAASTENGNEVIILRYYREDGKPDKPDKPASGSYKVVHTYYFRDSSGRDHFEGRSAVSTVEAALDGRTYDADSVTKILTCEANNRTYVYDNSVYGYVTGDTADDRPTIQDPGDTLYRAEPRMEWVKATENGDQIIILKYYRQTSGSGGGGSDPGSDDPEDHTTRSTEPATETTPESGTDPATETLPDPERPELPDPNAPDSPDTVTIMEDGVPVTYVKVWDPETGQYRYIPENELPLWGIFLPKTGDTSRSSLWGLLTISSLILLWGMWFFKSRERKDS